MYLKFFELQQDPFSMTPDPAFLYLTSEHREALAGLTYSILGRKGFVVLTGEAGTGKTTLIAKVIQSIPATRVLSSVVLNPTLTPGEFLETILINLGVHDIPVSKAQRLHFLQGVLLEADKHGKVPVLIVDEAHKVPPDVLEEIRLLSNFEKPQCKLLQIVLVGQTELRDVLNRDDLRQFKQRVSLRVQVNPLNTSDVDLYLQHRWKIAGGASSHPFAPASVAQIEKYSKGIPRVINAICDNALLLAYAQDSKTVAPAAIDRVALELELSDSVPRELAPPPFTASLQEPSSSPLRLLERSAPVLEAQPEPKRSSLFRRMITRVETA